MTDPTDIPDEVYTARVPPPFVSVMVLLAVGCAMNVREQAIGTCAVLLVMHALMWLAERRRARRTP